MTINEQIQKYIDDANVLALSEVVRLVRNVLKQNLKKIHDFTMAMGSFFFTKKNREVMWKHEMEELKGYKELEDFIYEWNDTLKLTGEPMTFTANGPIITNW